MRPPVRLGRRFCLGPGLRLLEGGDLVDAPGMPAARELAGNERRHATGRNLRTNDSRTHRQHVGVVVFTTEPGSHGIGGLHAANAADLVGHDLLAGPAAAQNYPEPAIAIGYRAGRRRDDVWVIDRLGAAHTEVDDLVAGRA